MESFYYLLADPFGRGKHDPNIRIPKPGDKIRIKDEWLSSNKHSYSHQDIVKIARMPYQIVSEVNPILIGEDGNYIYRYECYLENFDSPVPDWNFDFV